VIIKCRLFIESRIILMISIKTWSLILCVVIGLCSYRIVCTRIMCTSGVCVCVGWMPCMTAEPRREVLKKIVLASLASCSSGAKLLQCVAVLLACLRSGQRPCAYGSISHWPHW
jgi:hypothetical protein